MSHLDGLDACQPLQLLHDATYVIDGDKASVCESRHTNAGLQKFTCDPVLQMVHFCVSVLICYTILP